MTNDTGAGACISRRRPLAFKDGDVIAARALMKEGKLPVRDVAKRMGVLVATLYRHVGKRGDAEVIDLGPDREREAV